MEVKFAFASRHPRKDSARISHWFQIHWIALSLPCVIEVWTTFNSIPPVPFARQELLELGNKCPFCSLGASFVVLLREKAFHYRVTGTIFLYFKWSYFGNNPNFIQFSVVRPLCNHFARQMNKNILKQRGRLIAGEFKSFIVLHLSTFPQCTHKKDKAN